MKSTRRSLTKRMCLKSIAILNLVALLLPLTAGALELAGMELARGGVARTLKRTFSTQPAFLKAVGGVAFHKVAKSPDGLQLVDLKYDSERSDGERLLVTVRGPNAATTTYVGSIYDWELIPIAKYVASDGADACFTLFGELEDESRTMALRASGGRILNYHEAFEDTLMGLRLFQSDILILSSVAADLPRENGEYVLGAGEVAPNLEENARGMEAVKTFLRNTPHTWSSYVVSDEGADVEFSVDGNRFVVSGEPVWWCWEHNPAYSTAEYSAYEKLQESMLRLAIIHSGLRTKAQVTEIDTESLLSSLGMENEGVLERLMAAMSEVEKSIGEDELKAQYEKLLERELGVGQARVTETIAREELTRELTLKIRENNGVNPAVYNAVRKTMRFSAVFRAVKNEHPERFAAFMRSLTSTAPLPSVQTPNVINLPEEQLGMSDLESLLE